MDRLEEDWCEVVCVMFAVPLVEERHTRIGCKDAARILAYNVYEDARMHPPIVPPVISRAIQRLGGSLVAYFPQEEQRMAYVRQILLKLAPRLWGRCFAFRFFWPFLRLPVIVAFRAFLWIEKDVRTKILRKKIRHFRKGRDRCAAAKIPLCHDHGTGETLYCHPHEREVL